MRLFIALELPEAVISTLEQTCQHLQRGGKHPVKWVAATGFHLTLQFLGEVPERDMPSILAAIEQAQTVMPGDSQIQLHLTSVGAFPNVRRPQTLWVGVGGNLTALNRLHSALGASLEPLGFAPEKRPFHAHLTLGRVRRDASATQLAALSSALAAVPVPAPVSWQCGPPVLFESTLTPTGAMYRRVTPVG